MSWYTKYLTVYGKSLNEIDDFDFSVVRKKITALQSDKPLVSIVLASYNEEKHLLACLWSLSELQVSYPIEIIGVDNNSTDRTKEIYEKLNVPCFEEANVGFGYARRCGLLNAKGKYLFSIDSDTLYPPLYIQILTDALKKKGVVAVSGTWSFYENKANSKLTLSIYTFFRNIYLRLLRFKRPEQAVRAMVLGYKREYGLKVGIRTDITRGVDDGFLIYNMKKYGEVVFIRNKKVCAITGYGTLGESSLLITLVAHIWRDLGKLRLAVTKEKNDYNVPKEEKHN